MSMLHRFPLLAVAITTIIAASTSCADPQPRQANWFHEFPSVSVTSSSLRVVGPDGKEIAMSSGGHATSTDDTFYLALFGPNGYRFEMDMGNPHAPGPFTSVIMRTVLARPGRPPPAGQVRLAFRDQVGHQLVAVKGTLHLEELDAPGDDSNAEGRFRVRIRFENLVLRTGTTSSASTQARPLDHEPLHPPDDPAFVDDGAGGYAFTGAVEVSGIDPAGPPPSSSSGGSSGGSSSGSSSSGGGSCDSAWSCEYDGQATPMCQLACSRGYDAQTCAVVIDMITTPSCCSKCN